jgi:glycosyltransferase involved in cell wall biosynthesis
MACEVAVVATRVGGLPEIIEHGVTGFLCDADDVEGMAAHGIRLLNDPKERLTVARTAAADVRVRFCTDAIVPQYEAYYEEVLKTNDEK